eukprot:jgi/Galph1/5711/GphlegSOOS_G4323.1
MSIKRWFSCKVTEPKNNEEWKKNSEFKTVTIRPPENTQRVLGGSLLPLGEADADTLSLGSYEIPKVDTVSCVGGSDTVSLHQAIKEKSVRKMRFLRLWWKGTKESSDMNTSVESDNRQIQNQNNSLLKDCSVLAFLESLDRRLNDRRLPLEKSDLVRLETFQAQAMVDDCNELLDIIDYFEWENERCLLMLNSAGPSRQFSTVTCSS